MADDTNAARAEASAALGENLLANPGAEDGVVSGSGLDVVGDIPGWMRTGDVTVAPYATKPGRWPTMSDPGPVVRGTAFFTGGPQVKVDSLDQVVDLSALSATIDLGVLAFDLAAYLGGIGSSDDNVAVRVRLLDASGTLLGTTTIGPVVASDRGNQTGLVLRTASGVLPAGTRAAFVTMTFTGTTGQNCWGLADSVGLSLSRTTTTGVTWPPGTTGLHLLISPTPATVGASVAFTMPAAGPARVEVLDVSGRRVALLADGPRPAGQHALRWSPRWSGVESGVYFVRLTTASGTLVRRFVALAR